MQSESNNKDQKEFEIKKKENKKNKSDKTLIKSDEIKNNNGNNTIEQYFKNKNKNKNEREPKIPLGNEDNKVTENNEKLTKSDSQINNLQYLDMINSNINSFKIENDMIQTFDNTATPIKEKEIILDSLKKKRSRTSKKEDNGNVENRDHCNICKEGGELVCCDNCPRSFHLMCLKLKKNELPTSQWYCATCKPVIEKRKKLEKQKEERKKKREEQTSNIKKKKKLNYKKLKKERLLNEKKIITDINNKLISMIENSNTNENSAAKSGITDINSKNEEINDFHMEENEKKHDLIEILGLMKTSSYEKTLEFIKFLVSLIIEKKETKNKKKRGEKRIGQSFNDVLSGLNNHNGINSMISCIKFNSLSAFNIFKPNDNLSLMAADVETPSKIVIKYPIEDKLIYENYELHEIPKEFLHKPLPKSTLIPPKIFGKIIKIWDFVMTFKEILKISLFTPEELFLCLNYFTKEEITLINEIHVSLLHIFGEELKQNDYFNLQVDKELIFVKYAIESSINKNHFLKNSWLEIIRILINSKRFYLQQSSEIQEIEKKIKYFNNSSYNLLSIEEKIHILDFLINSAYETSIIREEIKEEINKRNELKKEKSSLEFELRTQELRKREIERSDKFVEAKTKIEILNNKIFEIEENSLFSRIEINRKKKEFDIERERYKSILKEFEEIETTRLKIKSRVDKVKEEITSLTMTKKKLIGIDYLKTEYYYFKDYNSKLFVKIKNEWFCYSTEEEIEDLLSKLSEKGINEKGLTININKILKKKLKVAKKGNIIEDETLQTPIKIKNALDWKNQCVVNNKSDTNSFNNKFQKITDIILQLEERLSDYLLMQDKEWESLNNREIFKAYISVCEDVKEYGNAIMLIIERFINPYKVNEFNNTKIINESELRDNKNGIFDEENKIDPYFIDDNRIMSQKIKFWPKDFENLELEVAYYDYLSKKIFSTSSLFFAVYIFESLINNFLKRREFVSKRISGLSREATELNKTSTYYQPKSKKIIDDIIEDESERVEEIENITKKDKFIQDLSYNNQNNFMNISEFYYDEPVRKLRNNRNNNFNGNYYSILDVKKKKIIDWKDKCYICDDFGELICCEECPNVVHLFCASLNKIPESWNCEECLYKYASRRLTRSHKNEPN